MGLMAKEFKALSVEASQPVAGGDPDKADPILNDAGDEEFRQSLLQAQRTTTERLSR